MVYLKFILTYIELTLKVKENIDSRIRQEYIYLSIIYLKNKS